MVGKFGPEEDFNIICVDKFEGKTGIHHRYLFLYDSTEDFVNHVEDLIYDPHCNIPWNTLDAMREEAIRIHQESPLPNN